MSNPLRDVEADYRNAYLEEYEQLIAAGRQKDADAVAKILKDQYGHDVGGKRAAKKTAAKKAAPERADVQKPAENTAEPKPKHKG